MSNDRIQFDAAFEALTGHPPFPWQRRLFERLAGGGACDALDVPTGLGKTSVIHVWLLAHLLGNASSRPPLRLVYVVNRRTIVDQATAIAEELWDKIDKHPELKAAWDSRFCNGKLEDGKLNAKLEVSTLRGAKADRGEWLLSPHRPAIIVGTVDMIGSRLLFNAYRAGRWQRSRHAGLLGRDALLVHDEAHLSKPFQKLIEWVRESQPQGDRRLLVMPMSATGAAADGNILRIDQQDRKVEIAKAKLRAVKSVHLHAQETDFPSQLAALATQARPSPSRIIVFVKMPDLATKVRNKLAGKPYHVPEDQVALLTGTIRGHERDELVEKPVLQHLLNGWRDEQPRTEYLIATSAGEVGADFDADHMVCDLSTLDAMIQRFGRVNRRGGEERKARIDVVLDKPAAKDGKAKGLSQIDRARLACADFLEKIRAEQGDGFDASPEAIAGNPDAGRAGWRSRPGYEEACDPEPNWPKPHDAVLDAWSLTSIQEDWPLAQDVHPYLHGLESEERQTFVAWRAELDDWRDSTDIKAAVEKIHEHYPLRLQELLHDKPEAVAQLLLAVRARCAEKPIVLIKGRTIKLLPVNVNDDPKRLAGDLLNGTIVLPASVGGLNTAGMIDETADAGVLDVADRNADQEKPNRARALLSCNEDGDWTAKRLPDDSKPDGDAEGSEAFSKWTEARDAMRRTLGMRCVARVVLAENEEGATRLLLLFGEYPNKQESSPSLTVEKHNTDVRDAVAARIRGVGFAADSPEAKALCFAAERHDLGKAWDSGDGCWQRAIAGHPDGAGDKPLSARTSLAKSLGKGLNSKLLAGYRHEFGSLLKSVGTDALESLDKHSQDLALHLIATHHGRGRPNFSAAAMKVPVADLPDLLKPAEVARRFDRLQRRYGHWGLAWLESILMSADAEASKAHDAPTGEDEKTEDAE